MSGLENQFQTGMIKLLNVYGCEARNIHGNMFQSGIPDVVVTSKYGVTFFMELKMWKNVHAPQDVGSLFRLLRKTQKLYISNVWDRNGFCLIVAATMCGKNVFYTGGKRVVFTYPDHLCKALSELTYDTIQNHSV